MVARAGGVQAVAATTTFRMAGSRPERPASILRPWFGGLETSTWTDLHGKRWLFPGSVIVSSKKYVVGKSSAQLYEPNVLSQTQLALNLLDQLVLHATTQCGSTDLPSGRGWGLDRRNEHGRRDRAGDDAGHGRPERVHVEARIVLTPDGKRVLLVAAAEFRTASCGSTPIGTRRVSPVWPS